VQCCKKRGVRFRTEAVIIREIRLLVGHITCLEVLVATLSFQYNISAHPRVIISNV
jgi:hypothetical protein